MTEFLTLDELHAAALKNLPRDVTVYLESGAGAEQTLKANREAFTRFVIKPRPMSGVNDPKTNTEVLGIPLAVPVLTAPFGGDALFAHDGQLAVARANAKAGIASIVPEVGSYSYEEVAAAAPAAARVRAAVAHRVVRVLRRAPALAAVRLVRAAAAGAAALRVPSGVLAGVRSGAGSPRSSGVKSSTTCRRRRSAASRSGPATVRWSGSAGAPA